MNTTTLHERDQRGVFTTTPEPIHAACLALLAARQESLDSDGDYRETKRLEDRRREAQEEAERVILAHQGRSYLSGLYRVDGYLVGMRKMPRGKGGLELVVYPTDQTKRGLRS